MNGMTWDHAYTDSIKRFPHLIRVSHNNHPADFYEIRASWCTEMFGAPAYQHQRNRKGYWINIVGDGVWSGFMQVFFFRDPNHAFEFRMRWT